MTPLAKNVNLQLPTKTEAMLNRFISLCALAVMALCVPEARAGNAPRIVNYVNFVRYEDYRLENSVKLQYEATAEEIRLADEYGIPATFLLQYDALVDSAYQALFKENMKEGWELGAWWEITRPHAIDAGLGWPLEHDWDPYSVMDFSIGYTRVEREKLVDTYMAKFKDVYGFYPKSVGSWYLDSYTLKYMEEKYGIEACCICKDQIGTDGYTLWGGYWNQAYYPAEKCLYMPAQTEEGQIDVPVFRMLGSDPIYQYIAGIGGNGQSVITLEPVYKGGGGKREWVEYFFDSMASQPCLAFGYAQTGQENSFTWRSIGPGLEMQMPVLDSLRREGAIRIETMGESGRWFKERFKVTPATAVTALDDFEGEGRKAVWYDSRFYRARLFWTDDTFLIQDIHVFDESYVSPFDDDVAEGREFVIMAKPVVDGFSWSAGDDLAGLCIVLADGSSYNFREPAVSERTGRGRLTVRSADHLFKIVCDEGRIRIKGRPKGWKAVIHNPSAGTDETLPVKRGICTLKLD